MKLIKFITVLTLKIVMLSCAAPKPMASSCETDENCNFGYFCNVSTNKCQEESSENIDGNLNQECKANKICNSPLLTCSNENICIFIIENKQCHPNDRAGCFSGELSTMSKGECKSGYYLCNENSTWDLTCINEVIAIEEICNNNKDDDCDGQIDEDCPTDNFCSPFDKRECYSGDLLTQDIGICKSGYQICDISNNWNSECIEQVLPLSNEICGDGLDNDCNGQVDDNCTCIYGEKQPCFSNSSQNRGIGTCKGGLQTCLSNNQWSKCLNETKASDETCDNLDNDCDGIIDNGVTSLCGEDQCIETPMEICNNKDDDCDGEIDEGCSKICLDFEVCGDFIDNNCNNQIDENCYDKPECIPQEEELCGDIFDNDCNLFINEVCSCNSGAASDCYSGAKETMEVGECKKGKMICIGGEFWDSCEGEVTPIPELCNNKDDDCDGDTDENFHVGEDCYIGFGACVQVGVFVCDLDGGVICVNKITGSPLKINKDNASQELCDNIDNDCDGYIDEDFSVNQNCVLGFANCQSTGKTKCSDDKLSSICDAKPNMDNAVEEICANFIDDNCDGIVDEITGNELCDNGSDDNCNGLIDEEPCESGGPVVTCPILSEVYKEGENKIYTLENYSFTATATDPTGDPLSYKWVLISAPDGNGQEPSPTTQLTTIFTPYLVSNRMDRDSQPYILKFTATEIGTSNELSASCTVEFNVTTKDLFHVELIWDNIGDMDLHMVVPTGTEYSFTPSNNSTEDCNFETCRGPAGMEWNGSSNQDNPYLDLDNTVGFGSGCTGDTQCNRPENINVPKPRNQVNDIYRVGVYAFVGESHNLKVKILCQSQIEDEFVVKEYTKDMLRSTSSSTNRWWKPANIKWHGTYCSVEDIVQ